ncbi:unnamed protein product [Miscanthus lutarioriparius]|uniref:Cathepsin propeptide inhibitor domain-containing protein n=1 Tax=Miscanthus lutarioriparius TaxID=422564 RepID=A0A811SBE7_9POAL|nr:unnamed protein product [Miscanthus lutarioriparius]
MGEESYEQETRRMFVGWKAKYGNTYRDVGEEECRYRLFKGNRRVVVRLNAAAAAGQNVYGLNQFGDLTNEEVQERCYPEMEDRELSARCQAAVPVPDPGPDPVHVIKDTVTNTQSIVRKRLLLESEVDRKTKDSDDQLEGKRRLRTENWSTKKKCKRAGVDKNQIITKNTK